MKKNNPVSLAISKLKSDTNFYNPASIEVALDSVASSLHSYLNLSKEPDPFSLREVIWTMGKLEYDVGEILELLDQIDDFLAEYSYPDGLEIDEPDDLEALIYRAVDQIEELVKNARPRNH